MNPCLRSVTRYNQAPPSFLMDRDVRVDVVEVPDDCPNVIGRICLMALDFVLDHYGQQIIPNPAHNGEWQTEEY